MLTSQPEYNVPHNLTNVPAVFITCANRHTNYKQDLLLPQSVFISSGFQTLDTKITESKSEQISQT